MLFEVLSGGLPFLAPAAPEVASAAAEAFHQVSPYEVERCVHRIDSLPRGGQLDIAAQAVGRAPIDYAGQPQVQELETRLRDAEQARNNTSGLAEKSTPSRRR